MAERGNTTHGPRLDDELKHETDGMIKGNHPTRAEEWREAETFDDGETEPAPREGGGPSGENQTEGNGGSL
jgi:hypothetical protein